MDNKCTECENDTMLKYSALACDYDVGHKLCH